MKISLTRKIQHWVFFALSALVAFWAFDSMKEAFPVLSGMEVYTAALLCYGILMLDISTQAVLWGRLSVRNKNLAADQRPWFVGVASIVVVALMTVICILFDPMVGKMQVTVDPVLFYTTIGFVSLFVLIGLCLTILMMPKFSDYTVETTGAKPKRGGIPNAKYEGDGDLTVEIPPPLSKRK